jgi:hypothetical protein
LHSNGSTHDSMLTFNELHGVISLKTVFFISSLVSIALSL